MAIGLAGSQTPLILGAKHFGFGLLSIAAISGIGAGAVQFVGNPNEAGPKVQINVPKMPPVAPHAENHTPQEAINNQELPKGILGLIGYRLADGGMTPWNHANQTEDSHSGDQALTEEQSHDPHVTTPAEAATALPADNHGGEVKILAPNQGPATNLSIENGVKVMRGGNVQGGGSPLSAAPIAALHAQGATGPLPIIAADGRTPFESYKRPFAGGGKKVGLIIGGLGLNARITERAISQLPAEVTLSFVPTADNLQGWVNKARANGHEVIIEVPLEPFDYPDNDPGPSTLLSSGDWSKNQKNLEYILSRTTGYFAVTNYLGGKFASSSNSTNFMKSLKARGLGFFSDGSVSAFGGTAKSQGVKSAAADRNIDQRPSAADINAQLGALEALAGQKGQALGFGVGYSVTIDQVINWIGEVRAKGYTLAPASALAS